MNKCRMRSLVACALLASLCFALIKVDPETQLFKDEKTGQTALFHGVNAVYKVFPWHPTSYYFDSVTSLCEEDAKLLSSLGFNAVRLGVMWPGVEIGSFVYNDTYLQEMKSIVNTLGKYGIYTIVDVHQDLFNRKFCGEGAPDFLIDEIQSDSIFGFPEPIHKEYAVDPKTGYPSLEDCYKYTFGEYYFTFKVGEAFQALYVSENITSHLVQLWKQLAHTFADMEYVLGYELINEPWPGDIYSDPKLLEPGRSDKKYLAPLYKRLHDTIRLIDEDHIIFFEPAVSDIATSGFELGPGGKKYDDRQTYSYHVYCTGKNKSEGDPSSIIVCDAMDEYYFTERYEDVKRIGGGSFMTEFGAMDDQQIAIENIHFVTEQADNIMTSWCWWQYKSYGDITTSGGSSESFFNADGSMQKEKVRALSRSYPRRLNGVPISYNFEPLDGFFSLKYKLDDLKSFAEIYVNEEYYYPNGVEFRVLTGDVAVDIEKNSVLITPKGDAKQGSEVFIELWPKS